MRKNCVECTHYWTERFHERKIDFYTKATELAIGNNQTMTETIDRCITLEQLEKILMN